MTLSENNSTAPANGNAAAGSAEPAQQVPPAPAAANVPDDLRVPWSWAHVFLFVVFAAGSTVVIPASFAAYLMFSRQMKIGEVQRALMSNAAFAVGAQLLIFGAWMLFLYVTIGLIKETPFWRGIGWRPLLPKTMSRQAAAWLCFFGGIALAIFVGTTGSRVHPKGKVPIEELFNDRNGTLMILGLAVLVAPLVEETIFRGFLYPVIARSFGVPAGVLVTGTLFGLLHGLQLGWAWELVGLLTLVGIAFTYVRARTGTVLASYLCHLGYNFTLFLGTALATKGFTRFPPGGP